MPITLVAIARLHRWRFMVRKVIPAQRNVEETLNTDRRMAALTIVNSQTGYW
jgi:hypothetical protein